MASPPFRVPAAHFVASLSWLLVAAGMLVWLAPRLALGRVFDPPVLALVHVVMLGVVASAIFGALNQFVPGALGVPLRSVRVAMAGFWLLQAGVVLLVAGLWLWRGVLQGLGWLLVFGAVSAVSYNTLRARRHSIHGKLVGLYLSVSHSALGVAMGVAVARIGDTVGWWQVDRVSLLAAHALLGALGFGTLSAIGVASRMLPTFLLGPGDDRRWLHAQLAVTVVGLLTVVTGAFLGYTPAMRLGGGTLVAGGCLTVGLGVRWFRRRHRALDPALWHVVAAFVAQALATVEGTRLLVGALNDFTQWAVLLVLLVIGWHVTLVIGVMSKILTHLSYNNLAPVMPGFAALGSPDRLLRRDWQGASAALLTLGWCGAATAIARHAPGAARVAALLWSCGATLTVANYVRMLVRGRDSVTRAPV
ncbi:MAG: hypothetical protein IPK85_08325 [Gemmatimonadetes bacterium]|nr:hypothetical protein [Gemmatimonadota bacterium]